MRKGAVYIQKKRCGTIEQDDSSFRFYYSKEWLSDENAQAVSLTLPLTDEVYESNILFPFFDGLIPEGYLLEVALRHYGMRANDRMGLLLKTCKDCIGDVSVEEVGENE